MSRKVADASRLHKLIHKASDVVGVEPQSLTAVSERRMLSKVQATLDNVSDPLHEMLVKHRSKFSNKLNPPTDPLLLCAPQGDKGSHSCLWSSDFIIPSDGHTFHFRLYPPLTTFLITSVCYFAHTVYIVVCIFPVLGSN